MRIHIIGIATTFMTGLAVLARQSGHDVVGTDSCIDKPTRTTLDAIGVKLIFPFAPENLTYKPDLVIVGTDLSFDNCELNEARRLAIPCVSGALWLTEYVLHDKWTNYMPPDYNDEKLKQPTEKKLVGKHAPKPPPSELGTKLKRLIR